MSRWPKTFAEAGFRVKAKSLPLLFAKSGRKITQIQAKTVKSNQEKELSLNAKNINELMYLFLSKLLLIKDTDLFLANRFKISLKTKPGRYYLKAILKGCSIPNDPDLLLVEIKAITYHRLKVEKIGQNWQATVVVDV
ncbi:MAG: archease [Patescibacteria group bacterium]|nr:archease [Patescibacteria group bacterium]